MNIRNLSLAIVLSGLFVQTASAVVIFEDNFNRDNSNTVGNNWSEIEQHGNDVAVNNGMLRLRDDQNGIDAAASQLNGFSTLGLIDIMLSYDWGASTNTEAADSLFVEWRTSGSSSWTELVEHALGGSSLVGNVLQLGVLAANQASIEFRFYTSVSANTERAFIDNVILSGRSAVSEPSTLAMMLLCLTLLGVRRKMNAS
ncbi:MAG: PEP-CTERM sorting domain-containing protein [Gammaproteobacteria bacterium]